MSRTRKGSKGSSLEVNSKRPMSGELNKIAKKFTSSIERQKTKAAIQREIKQS